MSKATEQSIKQKLRNISKELNTPFNLLLDTLFLERFLVRIGNSSYAEKLIFKGGMCLSQFIELGRGTKDIDFLLTEVKGNIQTITAMIEEIAVLDAEDNFLFSQVEIRELSIEHKKHPGYSISVQGQLGQIRNKVSIDIGVGDVVRPRALEVELMKSKAPLFEKSINLKSYPPEYIFSEKIEAILHLGEDNSRMKDFYDCYQLINANILDESLLKSALEETTSNRGTKLTLLPNSFDAFETKWSGFIKRNKIKNVPMAQVIVSINNILKNII